MLWQIDFSSCGRKIQIAITYLCVVEIQNLNHQRIRLAALNSSRYQRSISQKTNLKSAIIFRFLAQTCFASCRAKLLSKIFRPTKYSQLTFGHDIQSYDNHGDNKSKQFFKGSVSHIFGNKRHTRLSRFARGCERRLRKMADIVCETTTF